MRTTKTRPKSHVSTALRELRKRAGFSQEGLARELGVAVQTCVLWETKRPPAGIMLARLSDMALEYGYTDLRAVFEDSIGKLPPAIAADIHQERARWDHALALVDDIQAEAKGANISSDCDELYSLLEELRNRSWRNQR